MTLKEEMLKNSLEYSGNDFEENLFFTKLAKGFANDYKVFGEDTVELYRELFGEEYSPIFESFEENIAVLEEASEEDIPLLFESPQGKQMENRLLNYTTGGMFKEPQKKKTDMELKLQDFSDEAKKGLNRTKKEFQDVAKEAGKTVKKVSKEAEEITKNVGEKAKDVGEKAGEIVKDVGEKAKEVGGKAGEYVAKGKGFLAGIWEKIKEFGQGLADKFPQVANFLQKGVAWISANPAIVAATAGGAILLGKLISVMKKRGQEKKAAKLQAALDAAKKPEEKKAASVDTTEKKEKKEESKKSLDTTGKSMKSLDTTGKSMKSLDTTGKGPLLGSADTCKKKLMKKS